MPINSANEKSIFSTNNKEQKDSIFFSLGTNQNEKNNNKKNEGIFSQTKEGLFNQQTAISSSINNNSLFQSNLPSNNQPNQNSLFKTDKELEQTKLNDNQPNQNVLLKTDNQPKQTSLLTDNNPFLKSSSINAPPSQLFGNNPQNNPNNSNNQNQQNQQKPSLFGNFSLGTNTGSLFK